MWALLKTFSWQEARHHPLRTAVAVLAVMLGVALAYAVHLINASALAEFASATQRLSGRPDLQLRARSGALPESVWASLLADPAVASANPLLEAQVRASATPAGDPTPTPTPTPTPAPTLRLLGLDPLSVGALNPGLVPRTDEAATGPNQRLDLFAPDAVYLNPAAQQRLQLAAGQALWIDPGTSPGQTWVRLRVAGTVAVSGPPLLVMDIAAVQDLLGRHGELTGVDLRLRAGSDAAALRTRLQLGETVWWQTPEGADERADRLSRAYRVNLTVLALMALFTGAFLVYSVLSLGVAKRLPQLALLGVLGLSERQRQRLIWAESLLLGAVGSALGLALGAALAWLALRVLGGDLGGGYFSGDAVRLQLSLPAAVVYGALGIAAAGLGGWWPARTAAHIAPAQALKGLHASGGTGARPARWGLGLLLAAAVLALLPAWGGVPWAAYMAVAVLLVGGIVALPAAAQPLLARLAPWVGDRALPLLAVERARRLPQVVAVATSGVIASLALAVALTVMVASFRDSVSQWLDAMLPAPLYVRATASSGADPDRAYFGPQALSRAASLPGVRSAEGLRVSSVQLDSARAPVAVLGRTWDDPARALPLLDSPLPVPPGAVPIFVSEAIPALYGVQVGQRFEALEAAYAHAPPLVVAAVWRDYARQHGSVVIDAAALARLEGQARINDIALHLAPGADVAVLQSQLREALAGSLVGPAVIEFTLAQTIRERSLAIFDRSFAVTYWLQAVAIGIGLFGVAASFSAQVLARQREFGLLAHLGLTRAQMLRLVATEGLVWTSLGALAGLALGLGVSLILVFVVNPQSFHWTMDLSLPGTRLLALAAAVVACGAVTAALSARAAAAMDAVRAVRQDW